MENTSEGYERKFRSVIDQFTPEEAVQIAQVKRFLEWLSADQVFQAEVESGSFSDTTLERLRRIGVLFDVNDLALLWKHPEVVLECTAISEQLEPKSLTEESEKILAGYPLYALWVRFLEKSSMIFRRNVTTDLHNRLDAFDNPRILAWRKRRIQSVRSELGFMGRTLESPILAFELGDGCSMKCWFCAFATQKLKNNFDYLGNRDVVRGLIQVCVDIFGKKGAAMALPYHGTEPHDHPNYLDFLKDYEELTGDALGTSTAFPSDAKWMREILGYYRERNLSYPRLSVLSKSMLFKIHDWYTPDELVNNQLVMQLETASKKVTSGRILEAQEGLRGREPEHYLKDIVPQGTVACLSGFLINLVNQTIQLTSPCFATERWPFGYRVFDEDTFALDPADFRRAIEELMDRNMPTSFPKNELVQFRDDFVYHLTETGFKLVSPNQVHHFKTEKVHIPLGKLIAEGSYTFSEIMDIMLNQHDTNPMFVMSVLNSMFDDGFFNEVYSHH